MRIKHIQLFGIIFFLVIQVFSQNTFYNLEHNGLPFISKISPQEYDAHAQNFAITQDENGIMYFGNADGVLVFDGSSWEVIPTTNKSFIKSLEIGLNNEIFVGGQSEFGYIECNVNGKNEYISLSKIIPENIKILDVIYIKLYNNKVYFLSHDYLFEYDYTNIRFWKSPSKFLSFLIFDNELHVATENNGILKLDNNELNPVPGNKSFNNFNVDFNIELKNNKYLVFDLKKGLAIIEKSLKFIPASLQLNQIDASINELIISNRSRFGLISNNKVYLTISEIGCVVYDMETDNYSLLTTKSGLQSDFSNRIFEDKQKNLWFTHNNGISVLYNSNSIRYWDESRGLNGIVNKIEKFDDDIYVATFSGLFKFEEDRFIEIGNLNTETWSLLQAKFDTKNIYLIGASSGLYELKENSLELIKNIGVCFYLYQSKYDKNRIFVGTKKGLHTFYFRNNNLEYEGVYGDLNENIRSIYEEDNGNLWLTTFREEVIRINNSKGPKESYKLLKYDQRHGLKSLKNILLKEYNNEFVFVSEQGVLNFDNTQNRFVPNKTFSNIFDENIQDIFSFTQEENGNIWVAGLLNSEGNIVLGKPESSGNYVWNNKPFGLIPEMMILSIVTEDGRALIGGTDGIYVYNSKDTTQSNYQYKALIKSIKLKNDSTLYLCHNNNISLSDESAPVFEYANNSITFSYAATSYINYDENQFKYILEGFDDDWSDWSYNNIKQYTNLPEGYYKFKVQSKNILNTKSTVAVYAFKIKPPFYRTIAAYIVYFLFIILFVIIIVRVNSIRLNNLNERLERTVRERTEEIRKKQKLIEAAERKFKTIVENANEGIGLTDIFGNMMFANENLCNTLGYTLKEILELNYLDLLKKEDKKDAEKGIKRIIEREIDFIKVEREFLCKNGDTVWVSFSVSPFLDDEGNIEGMVGIAANIDEIKKNEIEIKEINTKLEGSYNNIKLLSEIGQEITKNLTVEKIVQTTYSNINELMDASVFAIMIYSEKRNGLIIPASIEKGEVLPESFVEINDKDRLSIWAFDNQKEIFIRDYYKEYNKYIQIDQPPIIGEATTSIIYLPLSIKDKRIGLLTVQSFKKNAFNASHRYLLRNIAVYITIALNNSQTIQKIENQKLEIEHQAEKLQIANRELEKLSIVANKTENAVVIMDSKGNFDWVNEGFTNLYEMTLDEFMEKRGFNIFNVKRHNEVTPLIKKCFEEKIPVNYEFLFVSENNQKIWVQTNLSPILKNDGDLYKVVAIDTNITKIKVAEESINKQKKQIEKSYHNLQLLSEIGKEVTSSLSIDTILVTAYNHINQLMDAPIFAVGLFNKVENCIEFAGKEGVNSEILRSKDSLDNKNLLSTICFNNQELIYIDDFEMHKIEYEHFKQLEIESTSQSLLYMPLTIQNQKIGVITTQSLKKKAYNAYHIEILKNIAVYSAIALENANTLQKVEYQREEIAQQKEELQITLNNLKRTQNQLVESAKMAALGNLVAGIAHEINTPVGVGLAASSTLLRKSNDIVDRFNAGKLTKKDFENFLEKNKLAADLIYSNLERTGELVKSFKQVSVDQSSERKRKFFLRSYIDDVIRSLHPKFKNRDIEIDIDCDDKIELESFPGVFAQIFTNLIINSVTHGIRKNEKGKIEIEVKDFRNSLLIEYSDNGSGISSDVLPHIFEPFFTTNMTEGTGLGMHILYNLITQKLRGSIDCISKPNEGVYFLIKIPK